MVFIIEGRLRCCAAVLGGVVVTQAHHAVR
jgi:hypothetical protein